jgi:hypothetical protein
MPQQSRWITGMTGGGVTAYAHAVPDTSGVDTRLLHDVQLNPLSAPFRSRMGYRPPWTGWEARPAGSLR